jgi:hypothetical protein
MENTITIPNIEEFTTQIVNGNLVLTRICQFLDEKTLFQKKLEGSHIIECKINKINIGINKYNTLLKYLYSSTDLQTIQQNTSLNTSYKEEDRNKRGYTYYKRLGISIQGVNARRTLKEIINIVKIKNFHMELTIKLDNDEIIRFNVIN